MKNKSKPIRKCPAKQKNKFLKKKYLVFQIHENEKRFTQSIKEKMTKHFSCDIFLTPLTEKSW